MQHGRDRGGLVNVSRFDFGEGVSELDEFVASRTGASHGFNFARRWTEPAWDEALRAWKSFHDPLALPLAGIVPEWFREATLGALEAEHDRAAPSLFMSVSEHVDWFSLIASHPDELRMHQDVLSPTADELRLATEQIQASHGSSALWVTGYMNSGMCLAAEALFAGWPPATPPATLSALASAVGLSLGGRNPTVPILEMNLFTRPTLCVMWDWTPHWPAPSIEGS